MRTKLQPGETVALVVRKHWLVLVKPTLALMTILFYLPVRHVKLLGFEALLNLVLPYAAVASVAFFLYRYLDRSVNIWAVTDRRLIDEWGILTHRSKENPLDKINDIVVGQTILGRIFGYGSISVQTAATAGETLITFVEKPEELKQVLNAQKAMRTEMRDEDIDRQRRLNPSPFSFNCPHCGGGITIDEAGRTKVTGHGEIEAKAPAKQRFCPDRSGAITAVDRGPQRLCTEEEGPAMSDAKSAGDPFGWKKHSR